jgi:thioredoxin reductase (NADPH)
LERGKREMHDLDVIIVGGGPAGLTAGLYLGRSKLRTLILEAESYGGKIKNLELIENYPGFSKGVVGAYLATEMQNQAASYGLQFEIGKVTGLENYSGSKCVICDNGNSYTSAAVIFAGGSQPKKLGVPGEKEFAGKGVFTCAFCDGGQFEGQKVVVCGGGDAGITEALYMAKIASEVTLVEAMPSLTASALLQERVKANPKLNIICGKKVEAILGDGRVNGVDLVDASTGKKDTLETNGILVHIGLDANTGYLKDILSLDNRGQIVVNGLMETEIPLLYAAGDIRSNSPGQVSTAVGDGTTAAISAIRQLQNKLPPP